MPESRKSERRKHRRYPIQKTEAVAVAPNCIVSFCLLDISEEGLAFCYAAPEAEDWENKECVLDFLGENLALENAPVRIVSDRPFDPDSLPADLREGIIPSLRRCGVQFLELSKAQRAAVQTYIDQLSSQEAGRDQKPPSLVIKKVHA